MSEIQDPQRKPNPTHTQMTDGFQECVWLNIGIGTTEVMTCYVTAYISLFKLGGIYDAKSSKTRPHERPSVRSSICDVVSETKYLVSRSWVMVAYTWYLQIFVEEA